MSDLPAPLVCPEVDLRDFPFMPLDVMRLFNSEFHAQSTDAEWRAGVTLWLKSWHQVPAASLPTDDVSLARLAEFARNSRGWRSVKDIALRGWILCSDGRLYHPVVAEKANEAWAKKQSYQGYIDSQRHKGRQGAAKRWAKPTEPLANGRDIATAIAQPSPGQWQTDSLKGQGKGQRQGEEKKEKEQKEKRGASAPPIENEEQALFRRGKAVLGDSSGGLIAKLLKAKGGSIPLARAAIEQASTKQNPAEYVGGAIRGEQERAKEPTLKVAM